MKAFIAVALFAACVAAQTIDQTQTGLYNPLWTNIKESGLGNTYNQILGQQYLQSQFGVKGYNVPTLNTQYTQYSLEEIVRHPLFAQYYNIPLFRQHFTHPLFQVYLTTPYFQQYWIYPEFQNFFRNPYLFYKYVYPVVFNTQNNNGVLDQSMYNNQWTKNVYPFAGQNWQQQQQQMVRPFAGQNWQQQQMVRPFAGQNWQQEQMVRPFAGLWDKTYQPQMENINNFWNKYQQTQVSPFNTGYPVVNDQAHYVNILDKVFKTQLMNRPEVEIKTDIKLMKPIDEQTLGKYVDPITGEIKYTVGDIKTVEDRVVRVPMSMDDMTMYPKPIDTQMTGENWNDALLKKLYLSKAARFIRPQEWTKEWTNKYDNVDKYEQKVKEQLNNIDNIQTVLPTLNRARRHAVYTPVNKPLTYTPYTQTYTTQHHYNKNAKSLNYYTVPLTYGAQTHTPYTYASPLTYTVPTYTHQYQYQQPSWYYPAQTVIV